MGKLDLSVKGEENCPVRKSCSIRSKRRMMSEGLAKNLEGTIIFFAKHFGLKGRAVCSADMGSSIWAMIELKAASSVIFRMALFARLHVRKPYARGGTHFGWIAPRWGIGTPSRKSQNLSVGIALKGGVSH